MNESPKRATSGAAPPGDASEGGLQRRRGLLGRPLLLPLVAVLAIVAALIAVTADRMSSPADVPGLGSQPGAPAGGDTDLTGRAAPEVEFDTFDGTIASLAQHRGRPVLVNFWASSCAPCVTEMPDLQRIHDHFGDRLAVVGFATLDAEDSARQLAQRTGVQYQLGFDRTGSILGAFSGVGLPTTVLIDREGVVRYTHLGAATYDDLMPIIEERVKP
jgi:peroxiredoxin